MPKLKSIKHEDCAMNLVISKGNKTQAMLMTNPDMKYDTARKNAGHYMSKNGIVERAMEIATNSGDLKLQRIILSLKDEVRATKHLYNPSTMEFEKVPDHSIRLSTKQFILKDIYGLGAKQKLSEPTSQHEHQHNHIHIQSKEDITILAEIAKEMREAATDQQNHGEKIPD